MVATQVFFFPAKREEKEDIDTGKREEKKDNVNVGASWWLRRDCYCFVLSLKSKRKIRKSRTTMKKHTHTHTPHTHTHTPHTHRGRQAAQFVSFCFPSAAYFFSSQDVQLVDALNRIFIYIYIHRTCN